MLGVVFLTGCPKPPPQRYSQPVQVKETYRDWGVNPYFALVPGAQAVLEGKDVVLYITVLPEVVEIAGVKCRVVEEREIEGGKLVEVSRNYLAYDTRDGSVAYFGEDVDIYEADSVVSHEGAWRAGVNGATGGVLFPSPDSVRLGYEYANENAPGVAMDRAKIIRVDFEQETGLGTISHCFEIEETNPLEPGARGRKVIAPLVGIVVDEDLVITGFSLERLPE